jgi:hypothetical protein
LREKESIHGLMEDTMMVNGLVIKGNT